MDITFLTLARTFKNGKKTTNCLFTKTMLVDPFKENVGFAPI